MKSGYKILWTTLGSLALSLTLAGIVMGACCLGGIYYLFREHDVTHDPSVKTDFVVGRNYILQQDAEIGSYTEDNGRKYYYVSPLDPANPQPILSKGTNLRFDKIMRKENFEIGHSTYPIMTVTNGPFKGTQASTGGISLCKEDAGEVMVNSDFLK